MRILMIIDGLPGGARGKSGADPVRGMQQQGMTSVSSRCATFCNYIPSGIDYQVVADRSRARRK